MQARPQGQLPRDHRSEPVGATGQRSPGPQDDPTMACTPPTVASTPHRGLYTSLPWPLDTPPRPGHSPLWPRHPTVASAGRPVGEDVSGIVSPGPAAGAGPWLSAVGGPPCLQEGRGCFTSLPRWVLWMPLGLSAQRPTLHRRSLVLAHSRPHGLRGPYPSGAT